MTYNAPVYIEPLTAREQEILDMLRKQGLSNRQIAERLVISHHTVEKHLVNIYQKIGVTSRSEAIVWANGQHHMPRSDT